ncbi:MAG: hypothetical protein IKW82_10415 [Bacteroidales bacterium]|nr:hypothetical protein [Bacteroidales bacterium]
MQKTRRKLILKIWDFGMEHFNFPLNELKDYLEQNQFSEDDINFGIAYVKKNFIKSKDLDEYLIDQSSITGFLTLKQNKITIGSIIVAILSLLLSIFIESTKHL